MTEDSVKTRIIETVASEHGVSEYARRKWKTRGVPFRFHIPVLRKAAEQGVVLTQDDLRPNDHAA